MRNLLLGITIAVACSHPPIEESSPSRGASADTLAIRRAAAIRFSQPDSTVARTVTIKGDTAFATVWHGAITATVVRVEFSGGLWRFVREEASIIR